MRALDVLGRSAALPALVVGDTARRARRAAPKETGVPDGALEAAIRWLCLTHDVTGRRGSALAYHLLRGWRPAFPETTGYIIGTLLEHAARTGDESLATRAREMGDWEVEVQNPDGGVMTDAVKSPPGRSVAFNTGMVIFGWLDLYEAFGDERYLRAAVRAGEWLERTQEADGTWQGEHDYGGIPHTYCSRVDWALLRLAAASGERRFRDVAVRHLDWVLSVQHENGWFDWCIFRTGTFPSTHALAYTMRGLLESAVLIDDRRYLDAAQTTARALMGIFYTRGWLPATYDAEWTARSRSICITGLAQVGGVWLRLYQETGDVDFRRAGIAAVEQAAALQTRSRWRAIDGAVAGSFPIYGRYAPLQYPNWAAKFLADSLALRERILGNGR